MPKAKYKMILESSDIPPVISQVVAIFARSKKPMTAIEAKIEYKEEYDDQKGHIQANNIHARISEAVGMGLLEKTEKFVIDQWSKKTVATYKWTGHYEPHPVTVKRVCKTCRRPLRGKKLEEVRKIKGAVIA